MPIQHADIKPGDVLLFHGTGFISWAIRLFDGTDVNHAAVILPDGSIAEAGGLGLQSRPIPLPGGSEYILVHRLKATDDLEPVVGVASEYLAKGHLYAYQQIVLLALLSLTRRLKLPRLARRLVRAALDHAATALLDLLPAGSQWMICSEYVYRCFDEAQDTTPDPYSLGIEGASFAAHPADQVPLLDWAIENAREVTVPAPVTFGGLAGPTDPTQRLAAIESDLAPLISSYATALYESGELAQDDRPPLLDVSFGPPRDPGPEPSDDELLAGTARFAAALALARGQKLEDAEISFGAVGATVASSTVKGALEGLRSMTVDPNFVTPGDLLKSPSLNRLGRLG